MIDREKAKLSPKKQWGKFTIVLILYILFLVWVKSWIGIIVIPFIYDAYITKKIRWQWWKEAEGPVRFIMSWVDAIIFALVAVYFINLFFFQNYVIPSSSLEKSLLTGDYLFVSKLSYGPRIPQTPLTMPLTQHTMPLFNIKSYLEFPHWEYRRVKGFGKVKLNDIVVFNYPAGDTIMSAPDYQANDYYKTVYEYGLNMMMSNNPNNAKIPTQLIAQRKFFEKAYIIGRNFINSRPNIFGSIDSRPTDRRENYVKRCVGLPGQTLQIKNKIVYLDGKPNKEPENVQYDYLLKLNGISVTDLLSEQFDKFRKDFGISIEDIQTLGRLHGYDVEAGLILNKAALAYDGYMPLTKRALAELKNRKLVKNIRPLTDKDVYAGGYYPLNSYLGWRKWTRDNYGPIWIPAKGKSIKLTLANLPIYERCIKNYEGNKLVVKGKDIYINGRKTNKYTFKLDYYWMQGDNRHNSADSRYWGFVPEDHIVGKPLFIWWSSDPDRKGIGSIRWSRLFSWVDNIK